MKRLAKAIRAYSGMRDKIVADHERNAQAIEKDDGIAEQEWH